MYKFVVLLVTFLVTVQSRTASNRNSNSASQDKYIVSTDAQNWFQAFLNCKNAGYELVSIRSADKQTDLKSYLDKNKYEGGYWTAGTNLADFTNYYWATTGYRVIYTNWDKVQPDNLRNASNYNTGEHCLQLGTINNTNSYNWNDVSCQHKLRYICEEVDHCKTCCGSSRFDNEANI